MQAAEQETRFNLAIDAASAAAERVDDPGERAHAYGMIALALATRLNEPSSPITNVMFEQHGG